MDKEFVDFLSKQFSKIDQRFDQQDKKFEEVKSYVGVIVEDIRSDLKAVAEGHIVLQRQVDEIKKEIQELRRDNERDIAGIRKEIIGINKEIAEFRRDNEKSFKDLLAAIKFSYSDLDHRLTSLETEVQSIRARLERLETRQ